MSVPQSKLTAQGQISVPLAVRRKLGIGPGSILEWHEEGESVVVRRAGRYTSEDIHRSLFPHGEKPKRQAESALKEGIRKYVRKRHARD
jgi:AbrB family looped-hinge helix DNA binding protein